jgi:starch synthase
MDGLLRARADDLYGIVNGVDYDVWDPSRDPHVPHRYDASSAGEGKALAKLALFRRFAISGDEGTPLLGVVARLTWLKGLDLVLGAAPRMVGDGARLVILGSGDPALEQGFRALAAAHPTAIAVFIGHDEHLAHLIQAASDIVLVPSRSEPCGLTQMYAMRYGALPLVRNTGGLADTVTNATPSHVAMGDATGFVFDEPSADALASTARWALSFHRDRPDVFREMRDAAMRADFGWPRAAREYVRVYELAMAKRVPSQAG